MYLCIYVYIYTYVNVTEDLKHRLKVIRESMGGLGAPRLGYFAILNCFPSLPTSSFNIPYLQVFFKCLVSLLKHEFCVGRDRTCFVW
jgi:hypothetical protein